MIWFVLEMESWFRGRGIGVGNSNGDLGSWGGCYDIRFCSVFAYLLTCLHVLNVKPNPFQFNSHHSHQMDCYAIARRYITLAVLRTASEHMPEIAIRDQSLMLSFRNQISSSYLTFLLSHLLISIDGFWSYFYLSTAHLR